jgi:SH3 domain protein
MKKSILNLLIFIIIMWLLPLSGYAKTGYVSDMLLLTFRQGPGNSYAVIKTLISNTPVVILEEKDGFYKVELTSNEIGWVDKKFIIFTTPKTLIINQLKTENAKLTDQIENLQSNKDTFQDKISSIKQDYAQTKAQLETSLKTAMDEQKKTTNLLSESQNRYNTLAEQSKNIQNVIKENRKLKEQNQILSDELAIFKEKNSTLFKTGMIKWFLTGAGVLLLGWIIGHSVSSRRQQTSSLLR